MKWLPLLNRLLETLRKVRCVTTGSVLISLFRALRGLLALSQQAGSRVHLQLLGILQVQDLHLLAKCLESSVHTHASLLDSRTSLLVAGMATCKAISFKPKKSK